MTLGAIDTRELDALCRAFSSEVRKRLHLASARDDWSLFATKAVLMDSCKTTGEVKPLFALKSRVCLRQDRSLLSSDASLSRAARDPN